MTKMELVIKNGRVYTGGRIQKTDLWIKEGKISKIGGAHHADDDLDARGLLILPGAIDAHVHFRDPGYTYKENWVTGSTSAVAGGVTTVVDQPNTDPPTWNTKSYRHKLEVAQRRSVVDFCLNGGPGEIKRLAEQGATAIGEIFTYDHSPAELKVILERAKDVGILPTIHAEDESVIRENTEPLRSQLDPEIYSLARPNLAEYTAIEKVLDMTDRLHICHLSTEEGLNLIRAAKIQGKKVSCEVAPHHLLFTKRDWRKQGTFLKMNPPLRDQKDRTALWDGLRRGDIDIVASDHAPHTPEEKREEIWNAPPGVPGVETMLPLMLNAVKSNQITLDRMVDALSRKPAQILGLKEKGDISVGKDADLMLINTQKTKEIRANDLHSGAEWTPYQGRYALFPHITIVRGTVVFEEGDLVVKPGFGQYIPGQVSK